MKNTVNNLQKTSWFELCCLFGIPTILNYIASQLVIPYLYRSISLPIEIIYFLSVGLLVLIPMFVGAIWLSGREIGSYRIKDLLFRMRIFKLSGSDLIWTICTFAFLVFTSYIIAKILMPALDIDATPFFFQNMPLDNDTFWVIYIWPLFFFFNIFGEEFLWRGYIQTRQELLNNNWTWFVHGLFWAFWHLPMGWDHH